MARKKKKKRRSLPVKVLSILFKTALLAVFLLLLIDLYVVAVGHSQFTTSDKAEPKDVILCLGAAVIEGEPSPMLAERLDMAIELYEKGLAPKILLSGSTDYGYYNEVQAMYHYMLNRGISAKAIVIDQEGRNTRASIDALKSINHSAIVVTQRYHLYRALYLAKAQGIDAIGVASDQQKWSNGDKHLQREHLARIKDWTENTASLLPEGLQKIIYRLEAEVLKHLPHENYV